MDLLALIAKRPLLLDGGLGRALMERGFAAGECPEEWNASHPAEVEDIHRSFFAAGSDIVNTNTFGGTAMRLEAHGLSARAVELNETGARLATGVRDREFPGRWVAGDIGPCGQMVRPMGSAEPNALRATFAEQARALVAGGVDLLNVETMFDLSEATIAVEAAVAEAAGRPVLASMAFKPAARGYRTMMGVTPEAAVAALKDAGAALVGCNCEIAAEPMTARVPILAELGGGLTYAQPNAGQPRLEAGETVYAETPEHFAGVVSTFPALGAGSVGGCCRTSPASIAALAAALGR
jgi:methionine synthase I (cobalamin-dependent)